MTDQLGKEVLCNNVDFYCSNQRGGICYSKEGCPAIRISKTKRELDSSQKLKQEVVQVPVSG
jgi:hypothetical protein